MSYEELRIHQMDDKKAAKILDEQIREDLKAHARQFVKIGLELRNMNLSGGYKLIGFNDPKTGWSDYLRSLPGLAARTAQEYVRAALVMECFADSAQTSALSPENMNQCLKLAHGVAIMEVQPSARKSVSAASGEGGGRSSPIKVGNPNEVVAAWAEVVTKHESAVERAKQQGAKVPKLSANKVREYFPDRYQNKLSTVEAVITRSPSQDPFDAFLSKMAKSWVPWQNGDFSAERIREWVCKGRGKIGQPWSPELLTQYRQRLKEWEANIQKVKEVLSSVQL